MSYAIIKLGGKQYVVREGEKLLVDRLSVDEDKTFQPEVIFEGGDGKAELAPKGTVTAKVLAHIKGEKIRIGKYRRRTGYRRHTGHRSHLTQIQIESIGAKKSTRSSSSSTAKARTTTTKKKDDSNGT
jgi:large subunit ribosomal protein L21